MPQESLFKKFINYLLSLPNTFSFKKKIDNGRSSIQFLGHRFSQGGSILRAKDWDLDITVEGNGINFAEKLAKAGTDIAAKITHTKEGINEWTNKHLGFDLIPFKRGGRVLNKQRRKTKVYFH